MSDFKCHPESCLAGNADLRSKVKSERIFSRCFRTRLYRIRACLRDGPHYGSSRDIMKIQLNCFTTMLQSAFHRLRALLPAAKRETSRIRVYHFSLTFPSALRFYLPLFLSADYLFLALPLSRRFDMSWKCQCINVTLYASKRTKQEVWQPRRSCRRKFALNLTTNSTNFVKVWIGNKQQLLWFV